LYNVAFSSAYTTISKTDADCECEGTITIRGVVNNCAEWSPESRISFSAPDENGNNTVYEDINHQVHDPMFKYFDETYTISGLCPGTYKIAYLFAGLENTGEEGGYWWHFMSSGTETYHTVVINGPDEYLDASVISANGNCYGEGSADITITGGNGGNTIVWKKDGQPFPEGNGKTSMSTLADGTYTVTITDSKGCTEILTFTIDNANDYLIEYELDFTNSGCDGTQTGQIKLCNVLPIGAFVTNAISINSGSRTPVIEGNCYVYNDLAEDVWTIWIHTVDGCSKKIDVPILEFPELIVTPIVRQSGCDGSMSSGRIELDITNGTAPYTYEWSHNSSLNSNIADGLSAGTYTVTVKDANGCEKTFEISITQVPELVLGVQVKDVNVSGNCCSEATALISGGTEPYTIVWTGGTTSTDERINTICTFPATHTVTVTDAMGCTYTEVVTNISCGGGNIPVPYPNPNTGQFDIDFTIPQLSEVVFELYDGFVKVKTKNNGTLSAGAHTINWNTSLSPGMYTLVIWTDGHIEHEGVLVQIQ